MSLRCKGVKVKIFNKENNFIKEFPTITSVALYFNVYNATINIYLNSGKHYKGFLFKSD